MHYNKDMMIRLTKNCIILNFFYYTYLYYTNIIVLILKLKNSQKTNFKVNFIVIS
jgi:hypothetical protein